MTTSDKLREFARLYCSALYYKDHCASGSATLVTNEEQMLSDLTALISEHYYPKEFVEWKDKKELRYSSLHNRYYSDTDNGMREFTLDELFNYWKEDEQEEHPTNKEKFDGNYLPDPD